MESDSRTQPARHSLRPLRRQTPTLPAQCRGRPLIVAISFLLCLLQLASGIGSYFFFNDTAPTETIVLTQRTDITEVSQFHRFRPRATRRRTIRQAQRGRGVGSPASSHPTSRCPLTNPFRPPLPQPPLSPPCRPPPNPPPFHSA